MQMFEDMQGVTPNEALKELQDFDGVPSQVAQVMTKAMGQIIDINLEKPEAVVMKSLINGSWATYCLGVASGLSFVEDYLKARRVGSSDFAVSTVASLATIGAFDGIAESMLASSMDDMFPAILSGIQASGVIAQGQQEAFEAAMYAVVSSVVEAVMDLAGRGLEATPEDIARAVVRAIYGGQDQETEEAKEEPEDNQDTLDNSENQKESKEDQTKREERKECFNSTAYEEKLKEAMRKAGIN